MREGMLEFDLGQRLAFGGGDDAAFQSVALQASLNQILCQQQQRTARKIRSRPDASPQTLINKRMPRRSSEPFNLVATP